MRVILQGLLQVRAHLRANPVNQWIEAPHTLVQQTRCCVVFAAAHRTQCTDPLFEQPGFSIKTCRIESSLGPAQTHCPFPALRRQHGNPWTAPGQGNALRNVRNSLPARGQGLPGACGSRLCRLHVDRKSGSTLKYRGQAGDRSPNAHIRAFIGEGQFIGHSQLGPQSAYGISGENRYQYGQRQARAW